MNKISFPKDIDQKTDEMIRNGMREQVGIPDEVRYAKNLAYARVKGMEKNRIKDLETAAQSQNGSHHLHEVKHEMEHRNMGRKFKWAAWKTIVSVAAAAAVFSGVCVTNPTFAAEIPLVGHVFEQIGYSLGFQGDFEKYVVPVGETEPETIQILENTTAESSYTQTVNGMTVTLSEQYCNETALYLSMILETEDVFPDTMLDQNGQPIIDLLRSSMRFDYNPDPIHLDAYLDGAMVDDHTYAGVLRVNLDETLRRPVIADNVSEGEKPETDGQITYETITLPEQFSVQFKIPRVDGTLPESCMPEIPEDIRKEYEDAMAEAGLGTTDDAYASFSEEEQEIEGELYNRMWNQYVQRYPDADEYPNQYENWWVDGPWEFDFDVTVDHSETISAKANQEENCDIGEIEVIKTPFELALHYDHNKAAEHDYFVVVLDADGELMGFGHQGGSTDEHPIAGHDVSEVTVYVCDYTEYMDELKGYYYSSDYEEKAKEKTFKQLLDERCVYSEKVSF